jgi:hypothetical protein
MFLFLSSATAKFEEPDIMPGAVPQSYPVAVQLGAFCMLMISFY